MKQEALSQNADLLWPTLALVLFILAFAAVVVRVWRRGATNSSDTHLASLPLQDDDGSFTPEGGPHG